MRRLLWGIDAVGTQKNRKGHNRRLGSALRCKQGSNWLCTSHSNRGGDTGWGSQGGSRRAAEEVFGKGGGGGPVAGTLLECILARALSHYVCQFCAASGVEGQTTRGV